MFYILLIVCLLVALLFCIAGCGKEPEQDDGLITLTITAFEDYYGLDLYAREYERENPNVKVVVNQPIRANDSGYLAAMANYSKHLQTALMTNTADDILCTDFVDYYKYADSGLLADIYPFLENDPDFNEDDYFMNVIEAFKYKGGLYNFPLNFNVQLIGVNLHINNELVDAFKKYDKVSVWDLLDLYQKFNPSQYYLYENFNPPRLLLAEIDSFVDREKGACDFINKRFLDLLNNSHIATAKSYDWRFEEYYDAWFSLEAETELSKKYMFQRVGKDSFQYIIPQKEDKNFTHFIPLASDDGKVMISTVFAPTQIAVSMGSKHKEAAWGFIKYLIQARESAYHGINSMRINKSATEEVFAKDIQMFFNQPNLSELGIMFAEDKENSLKAGVEKIMKINSMPMHYAGSWVMYHYDNEFWDIFDQYRLGFMTAEQVASWLQNRTELRLKE